ncbi:MAG: HEAT repeat domain-containing protein [Eubacteriaceae bacterium]
MFSNNLQSFIILNIYILFFIIIGLLFSIYYVIIRDNVKKERVIKEKEKLSPHLKKYIQGEESTEEVLSYTKTKFSKIVAADMLIEEAKKNTLEIALLFQNLGLDVFFIKRIKKTFVLEDLNRLINMKTEKAYDLFLDLCKTKEMEIVYTCLYGLMMLPLSKDKRIHVAKCVLDSEIPKERKIELSRNFDLSFHELFDLLKSEKREEGKVILIKTIGRNQDFQIEKNTKKMIPFLNDEKEIRIATMQALSRVQTKGYMRLIYECYKDESAWEVRVNIVKSLSYYPFEEVLGMMESMIDDEAWWVRYNVGKSLATRGDAGFKVLNKIAKTSENEEVLEMASYFLELGKKN